MKLDAVERAARVAAGAGIAGYAATVLYGLWRGSRRGQSRLSVSNAPMAGGSLAYYGPMSVLGVGLLAWLWRPLPMRLPPPARAAALILGCLLCFPGLGVMYWGRRGLGSMFNVSSAFGAQLYADHRLVTSGPFAVARHPIYLGAQLVALGALPLYRTWATLLTLPIAATLVGRARKEEQALAAEFGSEWEEYTRRVPAGVIGLR